MRQRTIHTAYWLLAITLVGCQPKTAEPTGSTLPQLIDVRPRYRNPVTINLIHKGAITRLRITRFTLPLDADLSKAWNLLESEGVQPPMGTLWQANGLRVHMIHTRLLDDFLQLLPLHNAAQQTDHLEQRVINTSQINTPLDFHLAFQKSQQCIITLPGDEIESITLKPGRCRLLMQSRPADDASVFVDITPQHYRPRISIAPRPIEQSMLDGRVFDELVLQTKLNQQRLLIIALHQPPKIDDPAPGSPPGSATETAPESTPESAPLSSTDPSLTLGRLILAAQRYHKPVQLILTIVIESPDS